MSKDSKEAFSKLTTVSVTFKIDSICSKPIIALKNADSLLQDVLKAVDTDGDGVIKYSGKLTFLKCGRFLRLQFRSRIPDFRRAD